MKATLSLKEGHLTLKWTRNFPDRPTIVFLHDALGSIPQWKDFPGRLAARCRCNGLVYERYGYGGASDAPRKRGLDYLEREAEVLLELVERLDLERPLLYGHSDGGTIALLAAARQPHGFRGLVTEAAHVLVEEITLAGIRKAVAAYENGALRSKLAFYHGERVDAVFRAWADTWLAPFFRAWNIETQLSSVVCPALVLQGEADEYGSEAQVAGIRRAVAGPAEVVLLEGLGHLPHKEDRDRVLDLAAGFIKRLL
ncbi:MAG: alpha/beta hydrolase [Bacteroidota bacterium]